MIDFRYSRQGTPLRELVTWRVALPGLVGRRGLVPALGLGLLSLLPTAAAAQDNASVGEQVDRIMAEYADPDLPGTLVAFVRGGAVVFQRAYGMADLNHGVPLTVEMRSNIGSTAKQFTAFAVSLLAEEGRLSLDDDVRTYVPDLPDLGEVVTLRHLLTHTSGYREFLNALAIGGWRLEDGDHIDRQEVVEVVRRQPELQNSPGSEWNYNNTGYALLAMVIEAVSGDPFPEWMAGHVFEPLGMTRTVVRPDPRTIVPNSARGYVPDGSGGFREVMDVGAAMGAGGVYTTLADLARWMGNLGTGAVGGPAVVERMTRPYVQTAGEAAAYGLGLFVDEERGLRRIQHGGGDVAHRSHFAYYPELDAGVVIVSNHGGFGGGIPARITEVFLGEHMESAETAPLAGEPALFDPAGYDPASFDVFVGRYELEAAPGFILTFRRDGDRFLAQATGQPAVEIRPTSDSTFALTIVDASITFHRDEDGSVTGLTLHQNGNHPARRLPDAEMELADLAPFAGRYYSAELETLYTVAVEDDALVMRHRRRGDLSLTHAQGTAFSGPFPLIQVVFERDDDGRVSAFRASNGRARDIRFERVQPAGAAAASWAGPAPMPNRSPSLGVGVAPCRAAGRPLSGDLLGPPPMVHAGLEPV